MCGIAGLMTANGRLPDMALPRALRDALIHRAPDGEGELSTDDVGMIQTRLAVIDLETGDQPLFDTGGAALVANGEIYNFVELRGALSDEDFATSSDCEPPLKLYRRDGLSFTESLRGMYAVAIHDASAGRLVLARDPFGIKPLYYADTPSGFAFASEPQALIRAGLVAPRTRRAAATELLQLQFSTGRGTIFEGIDRVLPGETLVVAGGKVVERRKRAALPDGGPEPWSEAEALEQLERALLDSVSVHQRSDVPYGMFLSGGIDSSVVLALMARLNDRPVRAFTAGFGDAAVSDEREQARTVAKAVGAEHVEVEFSEQDFWTLLPKIAGAIDDATADYAVLPTYKLAATARADDLKVILSGEGGDELFAGYGRYRSLMRPWWSGGRAMRWRGTLQGLGVLRDESPGWRDGIAASESLEALPGRTRLQVAQAVDCADWLPHDLLIKLDRCLMAHGVEGRTPMLDPAVASVAFRLPDRFKVQGRMGKWLLRRWLADNLPEAQPFARKRGFTVPVGEWIARRGDRLAPLVARQPGIVELCDPAGVERLFKTRGKRAGFASWVLLFYALWHNHHILGRRDGGEVEEALGESMGGSRAA
jgi:asparagine synthase (glutamine-hydrolysing)